jgi:ZIP family zinc transporter
MGIFFKEGGAGLINMALLSVLTSLPMGIGALLGRAISTASPYFASAGLGFAGGLILYITFRETLPEAMEASDEKTSAIGSMLCIITGILIISFIK